MKYNNTEILRFPALL